LRILESIGGGRTLFELDGKLIYELVSSSGQVRILGNFARNCNEEVRNMFGEGLKHAGGSAGDVNHHFSSSVGVPRTVPGKAAVAKYVAMSKSGQSMLGTTRESLEFLVAGDGEGPRSLTAQDKGACERNRTGRPGVVKREWGKAGARNQPLEAKQLVSIN
jgi:hypothetical protein